MTSPAQIAGITGSVSWIVIDEKGRTTVDRLHAAAACTVPSYALSGALATGYTVGCDAANTALTVARVGEFDKEDVEKEIRAIYAPLRRKKGLPYPRLENKLRQVMADYEGNIKTEKGLKTGLEKLKALEANMGELKAEKFHELMRVAEVRDLLLIGRLVARATLERSESRMGSAHIRGDCPTTDDGHFQGSLTHHQQETAWSGPSLTQSTMRETCFPRNPGPRPA